MNGIGFVSEVREICICGVTFFYQELDDEEGNLECYRLYNSSGKFVSEFYDVDIMIAHMEDAIYSSC